MDVLIQVEHLSKSYGRKKALDKINLTLSSGKIVGLLGPNGSGKTTFIKILNGLLRNYKGDVFIDKQPIGRHSKEIISYFPDEPYFEGWMSVSYVLQLFDDMYADFDKEKALALLEQMHIQKKDKIKNMSKGMIEKLELILVMSRRAKIYLLDEPIGHVDPIARQEILDLIIHNYDEEALILMTTHLISDIESIFDEVIFIKDGSILLHENCEDLRIKEQASILEIFKEKLK